jgi:hypothetical protein
MVNIPTVAGKATGLKVIGAGFGRTGTASLKVALEELGFGPCYHMSEAFQHPEHCEVWETAAQGQQVDWEKIFANYRATVDWPGCIFYEQFMEKYPDAKVLLSVRDPEKWYESVVNTLYSIQKQNWNAVNSILLRFFAPNMRKLVRMNNAVVWEGTFQGKFAEKDYALSIYNRHIEEVKKRVPPDRLLVYNVKEGWGPLCAFLGVEVPDKPFPHLNNRAEFAERQRQVSNMFKRWTRLTAGVAIALIIGLLLRIITRRKPSSK